MELEMDTFVIEGGRRLAGRLRVHGSKNASLPLMAAALMCDDPVVLRDVPDLADIRNMLRLLAELGCHKTNEGGPKDVMCLHAADRSNSHARYEIVRTMRAGVCVLGPLLARRGYCRVSMPGGCAIGDRPIDLHLHGMRALGAHVSMESGDIIVKSPVGGLKGATIFLGGPFGSTVLGTANVMCAATVAKGRTIIESAACEPEIVDLASLLTKMGAKITGAGSPRITIDGVSQLGASGGGSIDHTVMPDRIEAGTFMMAAAITNGDLVLDNCPTDALLSTIDRLNAIGVEVEPIEILRPAGWVADPLRQAVRVTSGRVIKPVEVTTQPHPGFPTDLQAQLMALLTLADGNSVITERIFPERFLHVAELARMGAKIFRQGPTVIVSGVRQLKGAPVMASDLRASACLVLAGLAAEGTTIVNRVYHLDRGYEKMEEHLCGVGAKITRVSEKEVGE
ncbi:MAG: UDP-N-acetylglucosamine 1-carboxyvinyltransferase [Phycisphaerales bacterium]|nr:UDP-N-acetylglucosamine 1-carboxyvinyltransferase [Phycisphaerales bacterium]